MGELLGRGSYGGRSQNCNQFAVVVLGLTISHSDPHRETANVEYWHFSAEDLPVYLHVSLHVTCCDQ